jgi:hypothetical protein
MERADACQKSGRVASDKHEMGTGPPLCDVSTLAPAVLVKECQSYIPTIDGDGDGDGDNDVACCLYGQL